MIEEKNNDEFETDENEEYFEDENGGSTVTTTLITGAAVAILAPGLLPGMAIGIAAIYAPRLFPVLGSIMRPLVKMAVQTGYSAALKTREAMGEASEQFQDLVAEAQAEQTELTSANGRSRRKSTPTTRRKAVKK